MKVLVYKHPFTGTEILDASTPEAKLGAMKFLFDYIDNNTHIYDHLKSDSYFENINKYIQTCADYILLMDTHPDMANLHDVQICMEQVKSRIKRMNEEQVEVKTGRVLYNKIKDGELSVLEEFLEYRKAHYPDQIEDYKIYDAPTKTLETI